ncbi:MAG: S41 family peptidase [Actinomycetota bacterium]|nr:S41 family peptidase [Actinomycetota bacterium]
MKRFKALKIILFIILALLVFGSGFLLGLDFTYKYNIRIPAISEILPKKAVTSNDAATEEEQEDSSTSIKSIEQAIELILKEAINPKTRNELIVAAIQGILLKLEDNHAEYFSKEQYAKIMESYKGIMSGGIGIIVTLNDKKQVEVVKIIPDSPSSSLDIQQGDLIKKVNGDVADGITLEEVVSKITGPVGTDVNITFYRPSELRSFELTIKRGTFTVPNFVSEMIDGNIAYIQYYDFQEGGAEQVGKEIDNMIGKGAQGIILDLRNNLGGVLNDAVNLCDLFLDKDKLIVRVIGRVEGKEISKDYNATEGKYLDIPLIVLINEYSASASELCAGAFQDHERAMLIGERSFGKGTVQTLHILSDGSGIKFTTAKYYLPLGESIDSTGIEPDIKVSIDPDLKTDTQKNKAVEEMKKIIKWF